jgi:hypothetical protein
MAVAYACDYCGYRGRDEQARMVEEISCEMCGEPVMPWPEHVDDDW